jgi:MFS family permease
MGLNEFAGYLAVAGAALMTGWIAATAGLRPEPFYPGIAFVVSGLALSALVVRETSSHVAVESRTDRAPRELRAGANVFWRTTLKDRNLSAVSQAGLVNNLNDGMIWGLFPLLYASANVGLDDIGTLAAIYLATWGVVQMGTGALSDHVGRKWLIASGMWVQASGIGIVILASGFTGFSVGGVLLGIGTAMVYPTLLAAIGDVAAPAWRASAVGVYRFWRDFGYVIGALLAGLMADLLGIVPAIALVGVLTFASGVVVAFRMAETLHRRVLA